MDLQLEDQLFVVTGATSGFGKAITESLIAENAKIIIAARGEDRLMDLKNKYPDQITYVAGDVTTDATIAQLIRKIGSQTLSGFVVNAGGPPASSFVNTKLAQWDEAYKNVLRWKVKLTQSILPLFEKQQYGRLLYIESAAVKQPIENLVLSNSLRLAVVGFVKTLSQEIASQGITANIIAPGYHATPAMERLFAKKSSLLGISPDEAKEIYAKETKIGKLGMPQDLASLATWILSKNSSYMTGQTITIDGGLVSNTL